MSLYPKGIAFVRVVLNSLQWNIRFLVLQTLVCSEEFI